MCNYVWSCIINHFPCTWLIIWKDNKVLKNLFVIIWCSFWHIADFSEHLLVLSMHFKLAIQISEGRRYIAPCEWAKIWGCALCPNDKLSSLKLYPCLGQSKLHFVSAIYTMHNKFSNCFVLVSPSASYLKFHLLSWRYKLIWQEFQ